MNKSKDFKFVSKDVDGNETISFTTLTNSNGEFPSDWKNIEPIIEILENQKTILLSSYASVEYVESISCKCPKCTDGKITVTFCEDGKEPVKSDIKCVHCNGSSIISELKLFELEEEENMWCKCENKSGQVTYHEDDEDGAAVLKHHWTCNDCGKIKQIG